MEIALIVVALVALAAVLALVRVIRQRNEATRERDEANWELSNMRAADEARQEMDEARQDLEARFKAMAADVLHANSKALLDQASKQLANQAKLSEADLAKRQQAIDALVKPVRENLDKFEKRVNDIEKERTGAYEKLTDQVGQLQGLTRNLGEALRTPQIRGMWGEQQLGTILRLAGMQQHLNFEEQRVIGTGDGTIRPDVVVQIPGGVQVVIDAKTPYQSFIDAHNAADNEELRENLLKGHARTLLSHAKALHDKDYSASLEGSPDFVVMFIPADPILDSAIGVQPTLWQEAWEKHQVLIATPGLLLAFLKTVALAWKEQALQENARQIADASKELYNRLRIYLEHVAKMGRGLKQAMDSYNDSIASLDRRVLPQARKLDELDAATAKKIDAPVAVDGSVRHLAAPELAEATEVAPVPPDS